MGMFVFVSSAALARLPVTIFAHTCINYLGLHRAGRSLSSGYVYFRTFTTFSFRNVFIPSLFFNGSGMHSLINNAVTQSKNGKQCPKSRI